MRALLLTFALALVLPPVASADGFRERQVRKAAEEAGFSAIADRLAAAARPTVLMNRTVLRRAPRELGTSRLGGAPDLPRGRRWPRCAGRPQTFLGQIRLRDLPREARDLRRHGGLLLVFTHVEFEGPGIHDYGLWAGRCTTLVHAAAGTPLVRADRPRATLRLRAARLRFSVRPDVPDHSFDTRTLAPPLLDVVIDDARAEAYWELHERLWRPYQLEHRLLGYLGTPNGEHGRCWFRSRRPRAAWRHLLTIGYDARSDRGIGFEVADTGRLQIAIAPDDLRRGRFERVCGIFDSA